MRILCAYHVDFLQFPCYPDPIKEAIYMAKVSTNISLDENLKKASQELYSDLGMDLSTAVTIFLKQSLRVQGIPFTVTRENPNAETMAAMNEYYEMKAHPEKYKHYSSFRDAMNEVLGDKNA